MKPRQEAEKVTANLKNDHLQIAEYVVQRCGDFIYDYERRDFIAEFLRAAALVRPGGVPQPETPDFGMMGVAHRDWAEALRNALKCDSEDAEAIIKQTADDLDFHAGVLESARPGGVPQPETKKENSMQPTTGRIVLYTLSADDAAQINRRRTDGKSIADRMRLGVVGYHDDVGPSDLRAWPAGAQAHIGNSASAGDVVPLVVVRVWPNEFGEGIPGVNGQALLDGNDALWIMSAKEGTEQGTWAWPSRS